jgi:hypothetical protein
MARLSGNDYGIELLSHNDGCNLQDDRITAGQLIRHGIRKGTFSNSGFNEIRKTLESAEGDFMHMKYITLDDKRVMKRILFVFSDSTLCLGSGGAFLPSENHCPSKKHSRRMNDRVKSWITRVCSDIIFSVSSGGIMMDIHDNITEKVQEHSPTGEPKDLPHDIMVISGLNDIWGWNNKKKSCAITTVPTAEITAHILRFGHLMEALPNSIIVGFGNGTFWGIECFDVAVQNITTILRQGYTGPIIGTDEAFRVVAARKGQKGSTMRDGCPFNGSSESEQVICNLIYDVAVVMNFIDNVNRVRIIKSKRRK